MILPIGFMQGRLCQPVDGKVQAFPWRDWKIEFPAAAAIDLHLMEWTLDQDLLYENPLMTVNGQKIIKELCKLYDIKIPSLTGDCFMQAPFWKATGNEKVALERNFISVAHACVEVGIEIIVVPLVDNGNLENEQQEAALLDFMLTHINLFRALGLNIIFESDFAPPDLARLIRRFPLDVFGINYDIGNSAALGYEPEDEFSAYGTRVVNVHVKDRSFGGPTLPLGTGDADFPRVFRLLRESDYSGNLIMQTARAKDNNHTVVLQQYLEQIDTWMKGF